MTRKQQPQRTPHLPSHPLADTARKTRVFVWVLLSVLIGLGLVWYSVFTLNKPATTSAQPTAVAQLVREDSHRTTSPTTEKAQLVQFVDFECDPCRAAQPLIEELKNEYGDRITFVQRYFPVPAHRNSAAAALAAEAAAQQGKYQQMTIKLFETGTQWGNKQDSQAQLFRSFAQDLGLDLRTYDDTVTADKTKERIKEDIADGTSFGVTDTPAFFLNGQMIPFNTEEQFRGLVAAAAN
ncbi:MULTISPECIES: thioredoxin domain-containing protein [unclassified Paenarthrobacter]|uniref:DsbA family protein n=1 Tax=unclassified Paenarthrobacter TaxID=2634190 RepID=UPI00084EC30A|nr:thioredoxin domain-containing protein [Paenarthrobacter sp. R1]NKR13628.1 disulfide bond formation protein DsbA [Arthrobacter sp. M5]NKR15479.1 disulfide bond formation protein DsbA [Arthrobacter sp. M6]OEH58486.1 disulfide bond formation protein DsbA [Arthrobacter sp. D2]OEH64349.1 disulfide bond formation protein DsbA [Arthrobacter sp. D4]WIV29226.1 thioredoxin domain-containing protein [Paenarthrobacter sp. R1]